jgi:hypothetical protein
MARARRSRARLCASLALLCQSSPSHCKPQAGIGMQRGTSDSCGRLPSWAFTSIDSTCLSIPTTVHPPASVTSRPPVPSLHQSSRESDVPRRFPSRRPPPPSTTTQRNRLPPPAPPIRCCGHTVSSVPALAPCQLPAGSGSACRAACRAPFARREQRGRAAGRGTGQRRAR